MENFIVEIRLPKDNLISTMEFIYYLDGIFVLKPPAPFSKCVHILRM